MLYVKLNFVISNKRGAHFNLNIYIKSNFINFLYIISFYKLLKLYNFIYVNFTVFFFIESDSNYSYKII